MNRLPSPAPSYSLQGQLLVAAPSNRDPFFGGSVCLIVEQNTHGIAGIVLNKPVISDVLPLWKHLTEGVSKPAEPPRFLHFGGPVAGPVVAIHDQEFLADAGNGQGVYLAAQTETLKKLVFVSPQHYRLLIGHAAWETARLEEEIKKGLWYVLPASKEIVFDNDEEMWAHSMRTVGTQILQGVTGAKIVPSNPLLN